MYDDKSIDGGTLALIKNGYRMWQLDADMHIIATVIRFSYDEPPCIVVSHYPYNNIFYRVLCGDTFYIIENVALLPQ